MDNPNVAFIGLGAIGYPIAGHLSCAKYNVRVFNRSLEKSVAWRQEYQGVVCKTIAEAVRDADFVITCVGGDPDLREIFWADTGIFSALKKGAVIIDHTSASYDITLELSASAKEREVHFLDAPVSGGEKGARAANLAVMVGGNTEAYDLAEQLINVYAGRIELLGANGSGQLCKLANQLCIAGTLQGIAEAFSLVMQSRLDPEQVLDVLSRGAASSTQLLPMARQIIDNDFDRGFAVEWMLKDLENCHNYAQAHGLELLGSTIVKDKFAQLKMLGCGRSATSILFKSIFNDYKEL